MSHFLFKKKEPKKKRAMAETEIPIKKELYSIVNNIKTTMTKPVSSSSLVTLSFPLPDHQRLEFEKNHIRILNDNRLLNLRDCTAWNS